MAIFLDTGVIVAADNTQDQLHEKALEIIERIKSGFYGSASYISDYIFDEVLTLTFARTGNMELSKGLAKKLLATKSLTWLHVDENTFTETIARYLSQKSKLSFTDCTSVELMKQNNIEYIATFDSGFKSIAGIKTI